jgi:hypothetical protein
MIPTPGIEIHPPPELRYAAAVLPKHSFADTAAGPNAVGRQRPDNSNIKRPAEIHLSTGEAVRRLAWDRSS